MTIVNPSGVTGACTCMWFVRGTPLGRPATMLRDATRVAPHTEYALPLKY